MLFRGTPFFFAQAGGFLAFEGEKMNILVHDGRILYILRKIFTLFTVKRLDKLKFFLYNKAIKGANCPFLQKQRDKATLKNRRKT